MKTLKILLIVATLAGFSWYGIYDNYSPRVSFLSVCEAGEVTLPQSSTRITKEFVEECTGRCRCRQFRIIQTVITAGVHKANKKYDAIKRIPRCQAPSGHNATLRGDSCMICPAGMLYSSTLRDRNKILQRMNLLSDICVAVKKTCMSKPGQPTRTRN